MESMRFFTCCRILSLGSADIAIGFRPDGEQLGDGVIDQYTELDFLQVMVIV